MLSNDLHHWYLARLRLACNAQALLAKDLTPATFIDLDRETVQLLMDQISNSPRASDLAELESNEKQLKRVRNSVLAVSLLGHIILYFLA